MLFWRHQLSKGTELFDTLLFQIERNQDRPRSKETRTVPDRKKSGPSPIEKNQDRPRSKETRTVHDRKKSGPSPIEKNQDRPRSKEIRTVPDRKKSGPSQIKQIKRSQDRPSKITSQKK